jgi:hypothetical protein
MLRRSLNGWLVFATMTGAACAINGAGCGSNDGTPAGNNAGPDATDDSRPEEDAGFRNDGTTADTASSQDSAATDSAQGSDGGPGSDSDVTDGDADSAAIDSAVIDGGDGAPDNDGALDGGADADASSVCTGLNNYAACVNPSTGANDFCTGAAACQACTDTTDDFLCGIAYSGGHICADGACVPGNCHTSADCRGGTRACANNKCVACDARNGAMVVVDPVNGVDSANTGSGAAGGGTATGACAFKTIGYALGHLGGATIVNVLTTGVVSVATNGETFPIGVPANVTIKGSGGTVTVRDVATNSGGVAFNLASSGSSLSNLLIDGSTTGVHGVVVATGAASTIGGVEVTGFTAAGVRAEGGALTITAGTNIHANGLGTSGELSGLHVLNDAQVTITGTGAPIQFNNNGQNGILVDGNGAAKLTVTGTPSSATAGSVVANNNGIDGVEIAQTGASPSLVTLTGLVATSNTQDGLRVFGGSNVQVRGSMLLGNAQDGVNVATSTGGAPHPDDVSAIDLGTNTTNNAGNNVFQSSSTPNGFAGVCLNIGRNQSQTLNAEGNTWIEAADAGGASIDCASVAGTLTEATAVAPSRPCAGGVDIGGTGLNAPTITGTSNAVSVQKCTCSATATCQ